MRTLVRLPRYRNRPDACFFASALLSLSLLGVGGPTYATQCADPATVTEIAPGIHVRQGQPGIPFKGKHLANVGFIIGSKCVAVVDTGGSFAEGKALRCAVAEATSVSICYVIMTHHHSDHVMGASAFVASGSSPDVRFIGHEKLTDTLAQSAEYYRTQLSDDPSKPLPPEHIVKPDRVIETGQTLRLDLGGRVLEVRAHKPSHTNNDLSITDSTSNVLWLGDLLFVDHVPVLDSTVGSLNGWIATLDDLESNHTSAAVPGHGPVSVMWPAGAQSQRRYLNVIRDETRKIIAENGTLLEAQSEVGTSEGEHWKLFDHHHRRTVLRAFTELEWE